MPPSKPPPEPDVFDDDPFSDFDIENEGASSTPAGTSKLKGPARSRTKPSPASKPPKSNPKTAGASASAKSTTGAAAKKSKGRAQAPLPQHDQDDSDGAPGAGGADSSAAAPVGVDDDEEEEERATIPPQLLTRILHGFFERDSTRMTKAANDAVARYVDVFAREAVARAAAVKRAGFLEVEDLEKIGPQLLLDM